MTTKAKTFYYKFKFKKNDILLFGRESAGVPEQLHKNSTTNFIRYVTYISLIIIGCYVLYTRGVETTLLATFYLAIAVLVIVMLMEGFTNTVDKAKVLVSRYT